MKNMLLGEKYEIRCKGMTRRRKDSLKRAVKVGIEIYHDREINPRRIDSIIDCQHYTKNKKCEVSVDDVGQKGGGNCKQYISFKGKSGGFVFKGYNDSPKSCPEDECTGLVLPTWNANVGRCYKCHGEIGWNAL
ncbi:MAG TPA: hypothetical protein VJB11_04020 [archaeon]|nr:hypothetical protein [archaeon]